MSIFFDPTNLNLDDAKKLNFKNSLLLNLCSKNVKSCKHDMHEKYS